MPEYSYIFWHSRRGGGDIFYARGRVKNPYLNQAKQILPWARICKRLKGQCHEIFDFWFFSWISFPQAPEYTIRDVSNFFENSRRYSQLKVHHRCRCLQVHFKVSAGSLILFPLFATDVVYTGGKFAAGVVDTCGNLPPVSTTLTSEIGGKICCRCRWYWWYPWLANISANFRKNSKRS